MPPTSEPLWAWVAFVAFVLVMLGLDLLVFHRHARRVPLREALLWASFWVSLAVVFNVLIFLWKGPAAGLQFLAGYLIEQSLSVDNLFVFLLIFSYFGVPEQHQHRVLFWGILGVLILRGLFIWLGLAFIHRFEWAIYLFGLILVATGIRMAFKKEAEVHPELNPVFRLARRFLPMTPQYVEGHFFARVGGRLMATPLFVVLLMVETTDLVFAVDSIPAIFAITLDPFIVFTSNVFAILGLRSYYFALAGLMRLFHHLHYGLSAILVFVGVKMLLSKTVEIPVGIALGVVAAVLVLSVVASILWPKRPLPEALVATPGAGGEGAEPSGADAPPTAAPASRDRA